MSLLGTFHAALSPLTGESRVETCLCISGREPKNCSLHFSSVGLILMQLLFETAGDERDERDER